MNVKEAFTYTARIYIAGPIDQAKQLIREDCYHRGLCVTIEPTTFIYTGGEEAGMVVGLVNYPRFPSTPEDIRQLAKLLAVKLIEDLFQKSALVVCPDLSFWITIDPPGARS